MRPDSPQFVLENNQTSAREEEGREFTSNSESKSDHVEREIINGMVIVSHYRNNPTQIFRVLFLVLKGRLPEKHELDAFSRGDLTNARRSAGDRRLRPRER